MVVQIQYFVLLLLFTTSVLGIIYTIKLTHFKPYVYLDSHVQSGSPGKVQVQFFQQSCVVLVFPLAVSSILCLWGVPLFPVAVPHSTFQLSSPHSLLHYTTNCCSLCVQCISPHCSALQKWCGLTAFCINYPLWRPLKCNTLKSTAQHTDQLCGAVVLKCIVVYPCVSANAYLCNGQQHNFVTGFEGILKKYGKSQFKKEMLIKCL